ncbi:glycosyltransferase family 2 protein [Pseudaquabacterium rugosum]|uniref:Glycosyltransferase family 2 protein n=1 Tax=Pseudaquabacterium rugosum TaxID=2984194 RepID=A0ABU9B6R7_9BURK
MKSMGVRAVAILVNWKGADDTIQCLRSLQADLARDDFKVVVVDNASPSSGIDEILQGIASFMPAENWIRVEEGEVANREWEQLPSVVFIKAKKNHGFAGGNNVGTRFFMADASVGVYWYLNNDTAVERDTVSSLCQEFSGTSGPLAVGSLLVHYDHPEVVQSAGCLFNPLTGRLGRLGEGLSRQDSSLKNPSDFSYLAGASLAVNRKYLDVVGLMSEDYFLYFEELDWVARARAKGLSAPLLCLKSVVRHKEGGSIGTKSVQVKKHSLVAEFYLARSYVKFYWRHHRVLLPAILTRLTAKAALSAVKGDARRARAIFLGMLQQAQYS